MHRLLLGLVSATILATGAGQVLARDDALVAQGRAMYAEGRLPDGKPLQGSRVALDAVSGRAAACTNCHRASGLGDVEGNVVIPPITGHALFGTGEAVVVRQDRRFDPGLSEQHPAYTEASFAAAVRAGSNHSGRALGPLMPRFDLSDAQLQALAAYLNTLSDHWSAGAHADQVHIATAIAPDMDPARRSAFLQTLTTLLTQMNGNVASGQRQKIPSIERHLGSRRKLTLDIWELHGPSSTWQEQLNQHQQHDPAFALLSGLGGHEWQPVQDFCDSNQVVCWFPSVDLIPANAQQSTFSLYLSGGVLTEARVMAAQAAMQGTRVMQLVGADPLAAAGAQALRQALPANTVVETLHAGDLSAARLQAIQPDDAVAVWLSPQELPLLSHLASSVSKVWISASLAADADHALPASLSSHAMLVQTLELPGIRNANLMRFDAWLEGSKVRLVDRKMQSEVYFAARSLVYMLRGMLNNLYTPYLIERAESTLSMFEAMQVQDEVQALMMAPANKHPVDPNAKAAPDAAATAMDATAREKARLNDLLLRGGTTMYPRLNLAPGQRIASKGAYLQSVRQPSPSTSAEPVWVAP